MKNLTANTIFLFLTISLNAQQSKSEFQRRVNNINKILKANNLAYYTDNKQNSAFIKQISASKQGNITFTYSIPKAESKINTHNNRELIPDCCPPKTIRTMNVFAIKKWDIQFPYAYLKDKNNQTYGRIIGIQQTDLYKLKEQFNKLTTILQKGRNQK